MKFAMVVGFANGYTLHLRDELIDPDYYKENCGELMRTGFASVSNQEEDDLSGKGRIVVYFDKRGDFPFASIIDDRAWKSVWIAEPTGDVCLEVMLEYVKRDTEAENCYILCDDGWEDITDNMRESILPDLD